MKTEKAIGCPSLLQEPRGAYHRARPPWPALLALTLVVPAVLGCPGHLDELPRIFVDAAAPQIPVAPINGGPPAKLDAAPVPAAPAKLDAALPRPRQPGPPPPPAPPPAPKPPPARGQAPPPGA